MATLTFKDVAEVDLGKLGTAVTDWKKAVDDLKKLATSAEKGMLAKSEAARWAGVNATVTRDFVKKVEKEFSDAHAQAQTIWHLINDAHRDLVEVQKKLKTALQEADALGVRIEDIGGGQVRWYFPHIRGDTDERSQEQLTSAQSIADRIARLTGNAMEIDASVTIALSKAHGKDPANFGHKTYDSLDDAQSERAVELAKRGPEMTDKQLAEFQPSHQYNAKDSDFSTAFYQGLGGPKQALEFFGQMSIDSVYGDEKSRQAMTQELQRNLGTALASATDPDNKTHLPASWTTQFRKLGTEHVPMTKYDNNPPSGYQLLGGIMRYGEYDPRFLNPIAEHVFQLHQKDPMMFADSKFMMGTADQHPFNAGPGQERCPDSIRSPVCLKRWGTARKQPSSSSPPNRKPTPRTGRSRAERLTSARTRTATRSRATSTTSPTTSTRCSRTSSATTRTLRRGLPAMSVTRSGTPSRRRRWGTRTTTRHLNSYATRRVLRSWSRSLRHTAATPRCSRSRRSLPTAWDGWAPVMSTTSTGR